MRLGGGALVLMRLGGGAFVLMKKKLKWFTCFVMQLFDVIITLLLINIACLILECILLHCKGIHKCDGHFYSDHITINYIDHNTEFIHIQQLHSELKTKKQKTTPWSLLASSSM